MNQQELDAVLAEQQKYLSDKGGGRANLKIGYFMDAYLKVAYLRDAHLKDANLEGTHLKDVNFKNACLQNANFEGAYLQDVNLDDADLTEANFKRANLQGVTFSNNKIKGIKFSEDLLSQIPKIENIHKVVYEHASKPDALNMRKWHTCETTHCWAGWVTYLAGEKGKSLEEKYDSITFAAALIYIVSDPSLEHIPNFNASNEDALADMKRLAEIS